MAKSTKKTVEMTPEIKAKLRGLSIFNDSMRCPVEIEGVPEEFQPVFILKVFTVSEARKYQSAFAENPDDHEDEVNELIRSRILGWENMFDSNDDPIEYVSDANGGLDRDIYDRMNLQTRLIIMSKLYSLATL